MCFQKNGDVRISGQAKESRRSDTQKSDSFSLSQTLESRKPSNFLRSTRWQCLDKSKLSLVCHLVRGVGDPIRTLNVSNRRKRFVPRRKKKPHHIYPRERLTRGKQGDKASRLSMMTERLAGGLGAAGTDGWGWMEIKPARLC